MAGEIIVPTPEGPYTFPDQAAADSYLRAIAAPHYQAVTPNQNPPELKPGPTLGSEAGKIAGNVAIRGVGAGSDVLHMATELMTKIGLPGMPPTMGWMGPLLKPGEITSDTGKSPAPGVNPYVFPSLTNEASKAGLLPEAETKPGRYAQEALSGAAGALAMPAKGPSVLMKAFIGGAGGAGGETAANLFPEVPLARVMGTLATSFIAYPTAELGKILGAYLGAKSPVTPEIVASALKGQDLIRPAATATSSMTGPGPKVTMLQAVNQPGPAQSLQQSINASERGRETMVPFIQAQNPAAEAAGQRFLASTGGEKMEPAAAATRAQAAGEGAISRGQSLATDVAAPYFRITEGMIPQPYISAIRQRVISTTNESPAAREFIAREVFGKLNPTRTAPYTVEQSTVELKNVINEAKDTLERTMKTPGINTSGINDHAAGLIRDALKDYEVMVNAASTNRPEGLKLMREVYQRIVNPMESGPEGYLAGKAGVVEGTQPPVVRNLSLLTNPDKVRAESISKLERNMTTSDPGSFPALARATWDRELTSAFSGSEGLSSLEAPAKFVTALRGTAEQTAKRENFNATMAGIARANGQPEGPVVRAANEVMDIIEASGRAKGGVTASKGNVGAAVENVIVRGGPGTQAQTQFRIFGRISDFLKDKAYGEIAKMLTTPEGTKELVELAKYSAAGYRAGAGAAATGAVVTQSIERNQ